MPFSLKHVIVNSDMVQSYEVYRSSGDWGEDGRWSESVSVVMMRGVISPLSKKDLQMLEEGDRIKQSMNFHSQEPLYLTRNNNSGKGTSDKIKWHDDFYKLISVGNYRDYGYYSAIGVRIEGD